ncbi:MAG: hypothetical protein JNN01_14960 [Opitutaceae bacterium]|nr:hypothetical protein [Opitutaceae bacterium]
MEQEIKATLIGLLDRIKQADGPGIGASLSKLDELLAQGRGHLHPQLIHFLEGRSYAKAVAWLGGEGGIPVGTCRGGNN